MVKDGQVRILMRLMNREKTLETAAAKAGMADKTARKYRHSGKLPSQSRVIHAWKTREDAFEGDWPWAEELLKNAPGIWILLPNCANQFHVGVYAICVTVAFVRWLTHGSHP